MGGGAVSRPLLFLDVDGPLNPYAAEPETCPEGYTTVRVPQESGTAGERGRPRTHTRPPRVWLDPSHGPALLVLGYEICWATTWMDDANRWIGPVLGLPELPYVDFGTALFNERADGVHWKSGPAAATDTSTGSTWSATCSTYPSTDTTRTPSPRTR